MLARTAPSRTCRSAARRHPGMAAASPALKPSTSTRSCETSTSTPGPARRTGRADPLPCRIGEHAGGWRIPLLDALDLAKVDLRHGGIGGCLGDHRCSPNLHATL